MENIILILVLVLILGGAVAYIVRAKKRGVKCIGCPMGASCGKKGGCNGGCGCAAEAGQSSCECQKEIK